MKLIFRYLPLSLSLVLLALAAPAAAKGPVDVIKIEGPDLAEPIEITDSEILDQFDPWGGQFIGTGGPLEVLPNVGVRAPYQAFFYLRDNRGDLELRYVFYYYPDPAGGRGFIYLPGSGEPYYRINIGTIIRGESDGRWHYAMPLWDALMRELIQAQAVSFDGVGLAAPVPPLWLVAVFGATVAGGIALWVRSRFPQRPRLLRQSNG